MIPVSAASRNRTRSTGSIELLTAAVGTGFVLAILLLAPARAGAQTVVAGVASGQPGSTVELTVAFTPGSTAVATLQFDLAFPSYLTAAETITGAAALSAGKTASGSAIAGGARILLFGMNQNAIGSGAAAVIRFSIASSAASGPAQIVVSNIVASDASGNNVPTQGQSGSVSVSTSGATDATPPTVSSVVVTDVSGTAATITWVTNKPADSQVVYGVNPYYGSSTQLDAGVVIVHSARLTGLVPGTVYHYSIRSHDAAGNLGSSNDASFTTWPIEATIYYPRMQSAGATGYEYVGIGIANLAAGQANLTFTAYNSAGRQIAAPGITNPVTRPLNGGNQLPVIDSQIFGATFAGQDAAGWVKITSDVPDIAGFYMAFNAGLTELDGATFSSSPQTDFVLPVVRSEGYTVAGVTNPNAAPASVLFNLIGSGGVSLATVVRQIPAQGSLSADLFADLFTGTAPTQDAYVRITADQSLLAYERMGSGSADFATLNALSAGSGSSRLFSPQFVAGGDWSTAISVVNLGDAQGTLSVRLIGTDGAQIGDTQYVPMARFGKVLIDGRTSFGSFGTDSNTVTEGYVEVTGAGLNLTGSVMFGNRDMNRFSTALPLSGGTDQSIVFGHVASDSIYYTGIAIVNPNPGEANMTVNLFNSDGTRAYSVPLTMAAGQRMCRLLTELFPQTAGEVRISGYVTLTSDAGVAGFAVFGTHDGALLSAIPPQILR